MTLQIDEVVVTLMRMIHTDDMMVVAARLVGRFVEPDAYFPYLLPAISGEATAIAVATTEGEGRARALAVCANMIPGPAMPGVPPGAVCCVCCVAQYATRCALRDGDIAEGCCY